MPARFLQKNNPVGILKSLISCFDWRKNPAYFRFANIANFISRQSLEGKVVRGLKSEAEPVKQIGQQRKRLFEDFHMASNR